MTMPIVCISPVVRWKGLVVKSPEEFMEILATYDLTRSYRDTAKICGVSHNTVRSYVKARQDGAQAPVARQRGLMTDPFPPQMASWVEQSRGKIRGDVVHEKLRALGSPGVSERPGPRWLN
jgi:hypothetical protein